MISYSKVDPAAPFPTPLWPEVRPDVVFSKLFGSIMRMDPDEVAKARAVKKSLLDFVRGDLNRIRSRLPASQVPRSTLISRRFEGWKRA